MIEFLKAITYTPLFNILILFYDLIPGHDFGLAIIAVTVLIRVILAPLSIKAQRSQRELNKLNPQIQEIRNKYKNDQSAQGSAMMALYKEHGVNPIAGCLPLLIQIPILIVLYRVFIDGLNPSSLALLYPFIPNPGSIHQLFLGMISVSQPNRLLAIAAGVLQFFQSRQSMNYMRAGGQLSKEMSALNSQMTYFMPIFIIIIGWNLSAGLILYWVTTTVYSIFEQLYLQRTAK